MAPKYKLYYFDGRGSAEPIRFLLSYLGEEFADIRYKHEEWPPIKPATPFGKLPFLEIDGKRYPQSIALSRYLGKKAGLGGKDTWEDLQIDIIVDTIVDLRQEMTHASMEPNEKLKAEKSEKLAKETLPFYLEKFDAIAKANNGYLANKKLSWGDIYFVSMIENITAALGKDITRYSHLATLVKTVHSNPKIKAWIDKRPKNEW